MERGAAFAAVVMAMAILAMTATTSTAQRSAQDFLDAHNAARGKAGVGPMSWDATLAAYAQGWANTRAGGGNGCMPQHSDFDGGAYGQNIWSGWGTTSRDWTAASVVASWTAEVELYDYDSNKCLGSWDSCLHYTQVMWSRTTAVGCGGVTCNNGNVFIVCSYYPRGNMENERPY